MSHHTSSSRRHEAINDNLPMGRAKLLALEVAIGLAGTIQEVCFPPRSSHLRDHLVRAADNTVLRLAEASGGRAGRPRSHAAPN